MKIMVKCEENKQLLVMQIDVNVISFKAVWFICYFYWSRKIEKWKWK